MHDRILLPFAFVLALVGAPSQASPLLQLTPSSQTIALDAPLLIGVHIAGMEDGVALGGYDLTVGFDTTLLRFRDALFGDPVLGDQLDLDHSGTQRPSAAVNDPGRLDLLELSLDAASLLRQEQANQFVLATLVFDSLATGHGAITLTVNDLADPSGNRFDAVSEDAAFAIVPIPPTAILLASALWPWAFTIRSRMSAGV